MNKCDNCISVDNYGSFLCESCDVYILEVGVVEVSKDYVEEPF